MKTKKMPQRHLRSSSPALNKIHQLYLDLRKKYGSAEKIWPQWCAAKKTPRERQLVAIGAILTQRTSWHNADLALHNLKKEGLLSLKKISALPNLRRLTNLIRPAGFYQTKPQCLLDLCRFVIGEYGSLEGFMDEGLAAAREELLALPGIGPETADTILLYAMDKPSFVIDEYTKRLVRRRGLSPKSKYGHLKELFEENLPRSVALYQHFHALIIVEEKGLPGSIMKRV
jgi:endonuclease-3 related protein